MSVAAVPTTEPGNRDLALALARHTQSVLQDNWMVGEVLALSPNTQIAVVLQNPAGPSQTQPVVPNVLPSDAASYVGARVEFVSGILGGINPNSNGQPSPYGRVSSTIKSVVTQTSPVLTTIMTLSDALPAAPAPGDRFVVYRQAGTSSVQGTVTANQGAAGNSAWPVTGTLTANQGAAGTTPWPVVEQPTKVPGSVAPGGPGSSNASVSANQGLFSPSFSVPSDGTILATIAVAGSGSAQVLMVTRDGGTTWAVVLSGMTLQPGQEYNVAFEVQAGQQWNLAFAGATVVHYVFADFVQGI